jgi:hypothetical protein
MAFGYGGKTDGAQPWEPSVKYLLLLLLAEIAVVSILRSLTNHGG